MALILSVKMKRRKKTILLKLIAKEIRTTHEVAPEAGRLTLKRGNKMLVISLHFSGTSKGTLQDKVKKAHQEGR